MFAALAVVVATASPAAAADSTTTVQATPSTVAVGGEVQLTAQVSCPLDPTGGLGVTFFDGGDIVDTVEVLPNGSATTSATLTTLGTHTITAAYNGNGIENCVASNNMTTVEVTQAPTPPDDGMCFLLCTGPNLIGFRTGDIHNEIH
jgi:hypothetical protein